MDDSRAKLITDALGRGPGLIVITGRIGGGDVRIYGRADLRPLGREFGPHEAECGTATALAISLAISHGLALVLQFEPEPDR